MRAMKQIVCSIVKQVKHRTVMKVGVSVFVCRKDTRRFVIHTAVLPVQMAKMESVSKITTANAWIKT